MFALEVLYSFMSEVVYLVCLQLRREGDSDFLQFDKWGLRESFLNFFTWLNKNMSCFGFGKQEFCQLLLPELIKTKVAWTHANDGSHASSILVSLNATAQWNENKNFTRTEYSNDRKFTCIEFSIYLPDYIHTRADEFGTLPKFLRFHFIHTGIPIRLGVLEFVQHVNAKGEIL